MTGFWLLVAFVGAQRLTELIIAKKNERWMREQGGYERGAEHYKWIVMLHVMFFVSLATEVAVFGARPAFWWPLPFVVFLCAQFLRVSVLVAMGRYWNTKIMILPGAEVVAKGPFRYIRHPNYVTVTLEFLSLPLMFQAYYTALLFSALNALVLVGIRIPEEEKALREATDYGESTGQSRWFPRPRR
ncbi:MAG TPA: isoprenylcysteine carboxyl methyltransferase family protein [Bacillales bacterium]|nr:isoprenylcysteine carboxyl methyltransferase family protein [Bacillales bacterium]